MRVFFRPFARAATLCVAAASFAIVRPAGAVVTFNVSFNDPGSAFTDYYDEITSHMNAAGNDWAARFDLGVDSSLEVLIGFPTSRSATGAVSRRLSPDEKAAYAKPDGHAYMVGLADSLAYHVETHCARNEYAAHGNRSHEAIMAWIAAHPDAPR